MSVGVNVLLKLVKKAAELLGNEYDVEIWEMHHNLKKDSPSGTAIELGKTIANASKVDFQSNQYLHSGSNIRKKGGIGFAVSRGGGVIGDHSVMFVNSDERIELNHKAIDRTTFARGAVQAARNSGALFNAGCDMSNTRASVKDLNLWYGSKQVLFDINLNIYKRKVTTFIGPSGCGKSTFLRCFNRMNDYVPGCKTVGELDIDGLGDIYSRDVDVVLLRAKVGMVFQKPNPFPKSIYDNVAYGPKLHVMVKDKQKLNEMVENSLTKVGLWEELKDRLQDSALDLSGGQQQRLCIARAIAVKPTILLMDEPCSALDPMATNAIENLIQELKLRFTIIMVTHSMKQAKKLSDSVIFFHNGRIVESGSTQEIFENAQSPLTKEYILDH
ncbi:UNVERIFIED_CONTAM: pstB [Trichonephila clavipes]